MLYEQFDFEAVKGCGYKGTLGDCYDRSFVRMYEMVESVKIVRQCLEGIQEGEVQHAEVGHALKPAPGEVYAGIENPRGELGHYIVSNGEKIANRMRVRSPSYCNLSIVEHMLPGCMLADAAAIIGSVDIVMGETDR
jgi:NADH-quinone oxidoreductase subunit D